MICKRNFSKRGQEEMVGFALIIIVVFIVLLFLLVFTLRQSGKQSVESYEVESFLQSMLQQTTDCSINNRVEDVGDLIPKCVAQQICDSGVNSCESLNSTLASITEESWPHGANRPVKGYELIIKSSAIEILGLRAGNKTGEYKGAIQSLPGAVNVSFQVYYSE